MLGARADGGSTGYAAAAELVLPSQHHQLVQVSTSGQRRDVLLVDRRMVMLECNLMPIEVLLQLVCLLPYRYDEVFLLLDLPLQLVLLLIIRSLVISQPVLNLTQLPPLLIETLMRLHHVLVILGQDTLNLFG